MLCEIVAIFVNFVASSKVRLMDFESVIVLFVTCTNLVPQISGTKSNTDLSIG